MLESKINFIISFSASILFLIIGYYFIFADIVKNIRKNKIIKTREMKLEEERFHKRCEIVPPSLFKINNSMIDLDSVIGLALTKTSDCIIFTYLADREEYSSYITIGDLNFIKDTDELKLNSEYKIIADGFSYKYYNEPSPETKLSKHEEIEKLYNQLLKWKALRKLYLSSGEKATIYDYSFYSMIKDIKFLDVERNVCNKIHQIICKIRTNSTYGIGGLENKQKENKNEKLIYIDD